MSGIWVPTYPIIGSQSGNYDMRCTRMNILCVRKRDGDDALEYRYVDVSIPDYVAAQCRNDLHSEWVIRMAAWDRSIAEKENKR